MSKSSQRNDNKENQRTNYTAQEKWLLLELVSPHKAVINNKAKGSGPNVAKTRVWEELAAQYNASGSVQTKREWTQLRKEYENMKDRAKREEAKKKSSRLMTGGGLGLGEVSEMTKKIMSHCSSTFEPLDNVFDSDVNHHETVQSLAKPKESEHAETDAIGPMTPAREKFIYSQTSKKRKAEQLRTPSGPFIENFETEMLSLRKVESEKKLLALDWKIFYYRTKSIREFGQEYVNYYGPERNPLDIHQPEVMDFAEMGDTPIPNAGRHSFTVIDESPAT